MVNETNPPAPTSLALPARRRLLPITGIALMVLAVLGAGYMTLRTVPIKTYLGCDPEESEFIPPETQLGNGYEQWPKPLVALVLTGQMHGYNDPCGCSDPQYGGLTRRYNFIQSLKDKKWDVVGIDLGELPQLKGIHEQNLLKYELSMRALSAMNYRAIGIGRDEIVLPLGDALAKVWDKNRPYPRPLNLSLAKTAPKEDYYELNARSYEIIGDTTPKIGVISLMGPDVRHELKTVEKFLATEKELPKALQAFADADVEIGIILHHEYPTVDAKKFPEGFKRDMEIEKVRKELALKCAQYCADARKKNPKIPPIQLMMILTEQSEPPALLMQLDKLPTQIIEMGHKGRYVGLIGVYRDGKSYSIKHQNVSMGPEWKKEGTEKQNAVIALMESYHKELKNRDMLAKFSRSMHFNQIPAANLVGLKSTYVGSDRCSDCHDHAFKVWEKTPHHKATATLEKLTFPSGRQYDPECMMCHTTGFKHPGGYNDLVTKLADWPDTPKSAPSPKRIKDHNDNLRGVSCESCHGPCSEHVKDKNNVEIHKLINPYRPSKEERKLEELKTRNAEQQKQLKVLSEARLGRLSRSCMLCHDELNDVNWNKPGNEIGDKWIGKKLIHRTPRPDNAPPAKQGNGPAIINEPPPPIVIEVVPEKKK
jgi:Cytochrome c554 and c-prime